MSVRIFQDERFYPSFKKDVLYVKMLAELGINSEESEHSNNSIGSDDLSTTNSSNPVFVDEHTTPKIEIDKAEEKLKEGTHVLIETLGIGQQGKQTFALYNVRVSRIDSSGKSSSGWNVLRRYSDFHTLHSLIQSKVTFFLNFFSGIL
ncbi:unnamed protein product [Toxocara canis]|uniref:PX domain-containing protein n=1 Tax=Toxocara canis TaxID=6265 RepID=A0A183U3F1_TOXCA|nr:unnamed protein product [Toxocara canis]